MKQIQIDRELFYKILLYFFQEETDLEDDIIKGLESKVNKIIAQQIFTKYKRAPQGEERERLRKEYIEHIGMFKSYQTDTEWHEPEPPDTI